MVHPPAYGERPKGDMLRRPPSPLKMTKCELFLTEAELISLLARDPDLWKRAIERGKWEKRARATEKRGLEHVGDILPHLLTQLQKWRDNG